MSVKKREGKRLPWIARYRDLSGRQLSRSFATKVEAEDFERKVRVQLAEGDYLSPKERRTTLREWWAPWAAAQKWRPSTIALFDSHWRRWIEPRFGDSALTRIKPSDIGAWHRDLEREGLAPRTVSAVHRSLAMALRAAERDGLLRQAPRVSAAPVAATEAVIPTSTQVAAVIAAWPERLRAYPEVIARAGLRPAEAAGLTWDRFDALGRTLMVDRQLVGAVLGPLKTPHSLRRVAIDDELVSLLRDHRRAMIREALGNGRASPEPDFIFTSHTGAPFTRSRIGEQWRQAAVGLDLAPGVRGPHALRHYHASALLTHGVPPHEVAIRLGHKNAPITLAIYAHVIDKSRADDRARAAISIAFDPR